MAWDGSKPPGQRVVALFLADEQPDSDSEPEDDDSESERDGEEVKRERGGRKYKIVTRGYMAQGHDGFSSLKGQPYLIGEEDGQMMSTIVRNYLLVSWPHLIQDRS
jgi:5'-nucleotidase